MSGVARRGEVLAIMGPSGSGKTSLLNALALTSTIEVSGTIEVDNTTATKGRHRVLAGYVRQECIFVEVLTVRETLYYAAQLSLPWDDPKEEKTARVEQASRPTNFLTISCMFFMKLPQRAPLD